ncbi:hypothetical protein K7640_09205 [Micromonospora sp. PLK6-60]|uniref:hypothetical protein n=1 Tax=Micromonospora sp. PLK6-60 TaxID=2873383 RepID=UPI001CA640B0|nr:hypothetical protein [Micromonospora sp. PLK6-60]MBY8872017.1 hypothetical protein [Micromonospora sp. PLK6-60]
MSGRRSAFAGDRLLPGIDNLDARIGEVLAVSGGENGNLGPADGGNLGVEPVDRVTEPLPAGDDVGIGAGRREVEGQHLAREGGEDLVGGLVRRFPAVTLGQPRNFSRTASSRSLMLIAAIALSSAPTGDSNAIAAHRTGRHSTPARSGQTTEAGADEAGRPGWSTPGQSETRRRPECWASGEVS